MVNGIFRAPEWGGQASWFTGTESVSEREDTTGSTKVSHECLDWEFGRGETGQCQPANVMIRDAQPLRHGFNTVLQSQLTLHAL